MATKTSIITVEFAKKEVDDLLIEKAKEIAGQKAGTAKIESISTNGNAGGIRVVFQSAG